MNTAERSTKTVIVYEVLCGESVVCSAQMCLTKREAKNKVTNERRLNGGRDWDIRPVSVLMEQK